MMKINKFLNPFYIWLFLVTANAGIMSWSTFESSKASYTDYMGEAYLSAFMSFFSLVIFFISMLRKGNDGIILGLVLIIPVFLGFYIIDQLTFQVARFIIKGYL